MEAFAQMKAQILVLQLAYFCLGSTEGSCESCRKLLFGMLNLYACLPRSLQPAFMKVLDSNAVPHTGDSEDSSDTEEASSETASYMQAETY